MGIIASQAARELGISTRTLATWADQGKIQTERSAAGWRFYPPEEVARLKKELLNRQRSTRFKSL